MVDQRWTPSARACRTWSRRSPTWWVGTDHGPDHRGREGGWLGGRRRRRLTWCWLVGVLQVCERAKSGKNYGTVLVPEGLVLSIPEMAVLINEVDDIFRYYLLHTTPPTPAPRRRPQGGPLCVWLLS